MDTASSLEKEFLRCPICLDNYNNPRGLPCLHIVCSQCLTSLMDGKQRFPCPICKNDTLSPVDGVYGFPIAFHINALQDFATNCESDRPTIPCHNKKNQTCHADSSVKCLDCNVSYCEYCNRAHKMVPIAENHKTIPFSDLTQQHFKEASQRQVHFCQQHPTFPLNFYCKDKSCQIPVCQTCIMTEHKPHKSVELEEVSTKYRQENKKMLEKKFLDTKAALEMKKEEAKREKQKLNNQFEENKTLIQNQYLKMIEDLNQQIQKLMNDALKSKDEKIRDCEQQLTEIDHKLASLETTKGVIENITNFSPDAVIAKQHIELQDQEVKFFEEMAPPDIWVHNTEVTSVGEPVVEMNLVSKTKSHKTMKCLDAIDDIVLLDDFLIAWEFKPKNTPTDFFVSGQSTRKAERLKKKLEYNCPQTYRMAPVKRDGHEVLVIIEALQRPLHHINILNINDGECETIQLEESVYPYAVTVDRRNVNNIIFTDHVLTNKAVRKWTNIGMQTIFEDKHRENILADPWHVTVNINNDVIISDHGKKTLIIFDEAGNVRNTYDNFKTRNDNNPKGVCTDDKGNIYVCDRYGHCVHQLDMDGVFLGYVFKRSDGLFEPTAIVYRNGMFVVGQADGHIKYFKI